MLFETNISLLPHNTFGIDVRASKFLNIVNEADVASLFTTLKEKNSDFMILGGGSNILFTKDYDGLVIKNGLQGIKLVEETESEVVVEAAAGENWHQFVLYCLDNGWNGLENLSLIPGTVGASPIQNIGAYGIEVKDTCESVDFYNITTGETKTFSASECKFGYRESVFKTTLKGEFFITKVRFRLSKNTNVDVTYGAIKDTLKDNNISNPTPRDVSNAVIAIRSSKLPNPKEIGNGGSFFKNPIIPISQLEDIKKKFEDIVYYPLNDNFVKVPAGWLIDQAGWKGKTFGNVGVHKNQALVLVNYGGGSGLEVQELSTKIIDSIDEIYGIKLIPEINIV